MELTTIAHRLEKVGNTEVVATAGQTVKIKTTPNGEEVLVEVVPAGKSWAVHVSVYIEESDA